ncbi:hypothetical protein ACFOU0_05900 [Salinicoccus sesuvii]|uniref:Uncharacterized protein n=1 Tax=Salinicoccus sesuvii TaxID=868281 RepID=A0ABV7N3A5_9STAP
MEYEYGVAKIIDNYTLVISGGELDGIRKGDTVKILDQSGITINNPYSGKDLGQLPRIKQELIVERVYDEFSICTTLTETSYSTLDSMTMANKKAYGILNNFNETKEVKKRLNIDSIEPVDLGSNNVIKVGDPVVIEK